MIFDCSDSLGDHTDLRPAEGINGVDDVNARRRQPIEHAPVQEGLIGAHDIHSELYEKRNVQVGEAREVEPLGVTNAHTHRVPAQAGEQQRLAVFQQAPAIHHDAGGRLGQPGVELWRGRLSPGSRIGPSHNRAPRPAGAHGLLDRW